VFNSNTSRFKYCNINNFQYKLTYLITYRNLYILNIIKDFKR
jgi:hypothetical protein